MRKSGYFAGAHDDDRPIRPADRLEVPLADPEATTPTILIEVARPGVGGGDRSGWALPLFGVVTPTRIYLVRARDEHTARYCIGTQAEVVAVTEVRETVGFPAYSEKGKRGTVTIPDREDER